MMKRISLGLLLMSVGLAFFGLNFQAEGQQFGSNWQAQFFNNTTFTAPAVASTTHSQINFNYGASAPQAGVNPDNFSILWNAAITFTAGTYRFTAVADDGVRVSINGQVIIDRLTSTGSLQTATADVAMADGSATIQVQYVEVTGNGVVQFYWDAVSTGPTATPGPTFTPSATGLPSIPAGALTATVINASVLNVRDAPSLGGNVLDRVLRGQTYQIVGRNENATWFLVQLSNKQGWVWGYYVYVNGNEFNAPVTSALAAQGLPAGVTDTGVLAVTQAGLKLRSQATVNSAQIGRVTWGSFVPVVGRTSDNGWYQIVWKGTVGWVASGYLEIRQGDLSAVPVR